MVMQSPLLLTCREDFTEVLMEEISLRHNNKSFRIIAKRPGLIVIDMPMKTVFNKPLIFEWQRILNARLFPIISNKKTVREIVKNLMVAIPAESKWLCHVFAHKVSLSTKAMSFQKIFAEFLKKRFPLFYRHCSSFFGGEKCMCDADMPVLNLCVTDDGIWGSVMPYKYLSDGRPGGIHRMAFDRNAPSRSYLKIEEAFEVMGCEPSCGERVIDLGASPGGWTYAFLKRGCYVTAVDNGEIRLANVSRYKGRLFHLRQDGTLFEPSKIELPVDWLVSDMLVSTGTNLWVLKKWLKNQWMRRFIVNIKLPQTHIYKVLQPIEAYMKNINNMKFRIKHLYHDRREVTLMGEFYL